MRSGGLFPATEAPLAQDQPEKRMPIGSQTPGSQHHHHQYPQHSQDAQLPQKAQQVVWWHARPAAKTQGTATAHAANAAVQGSSHRATSGAPRLSGGQGNRSAIDALVRARDAIKLHASNITTAARALRDRMVTIGRRNPERPLARAAILDNRADVKLRDSLKTAVRSLVQALSNPTKDAARQPDAALGALETATNSTRNPRTAAKDAASKVLAEFTPGEVARFSRQLQGMKPEISSSDAFLGLKDAANEASDRAEVSLRDSRTDAVRSLIHVLLNPSQDSVRKRDAALGALQAAANPTENPRAAARDAASKVLADLTPDEAAMFALRFNITKTGTKLPDALLGLHDAADEASKRVSLSDSRNAAVHSLVHVLLNPSMELDGQRDAALDALDAAATATENPRAATRDAASKVLANLTPADAAMFTARLAIMRPGINLFSDALLGLKDAATEASNSAGGNLRDAGKESARSLVNILLDSSENAGSRQRDAALGGLEAAANATTNPRAAAKNVVSEALADLTPAETAMFKLQVKAMKPGTSVSGALLGLNDAADEASNFSLPESRKIAASFLVHALLHPSRDSDRQRDAAIDALEDGANLTEDPRAAARNAISEVLATFTRGDRQDAMLKLQMALAKKSGLPGALLGLQDAADEALAPAEVMAEALRDLGSKKPENQLYLLEGESVDSGVSHALWADMMRCPYVSIDLNGKREPLMKKPPGEGHAAELHQAIKKFAQRVTGGDIEQLKMLGKYAMQSIWEPVLRSALSTHSPFHLHGDPNHRGSINGHSPTEFDIQPIDPRVDQEGGYTVTCRISYDRDLHFRSNRTGDMIQLDPASKAEGQLTLVVRPDGSATCTQLPKFTCHLYPMGEAPRVRQWWN